MGFRKNRQEIILPPPPPTSSVLSAPPPVSTIDNVDSEVPILKSGFVDLVKEEEKPVEQPSIDVQIEQKKPAKKQSKKKRLPDSDSGNTDNKQ